MPALYSFTALKVNSECSLLHGRGHSKGYCSCLNNKSERLLSIFTCKCDFLLMFEKNTLFCSSDLGVNLENVLSFCTSENDCNQVRTVKSSAQIMYHSMLVAE